MALKNNAKKQASIHSFLLPGTPPAPPSRLKKGSSSPSSSSSTPEYERARQENILKNQAFLKSLGINIQSSSHLSTDPTNPRKRPLKSTPASPPPVPIRRSTRRRGGGIELRPDIDYASRKRINEKEGAASEEIEAIDPEQISRSAIFNYVSHTPPLELHNYQSTVPSSPIIGFTIGSRSLFDPSLLKIYTIDVSFINDGRLLITAGGHGGHVAIFTGGDEEGPIMSWKASRCWVSGALFMGEDPKLLATSSNDGSVVVWNLERQISAAPSSPPVTVVESSGLHSGGIFSMDRLGCMIATASKDSSVGLSRLAEGKLSVERRIEGHHSGVIKAICFRKNINILADGGADGRICLLDSRAKHPCFLTIDTPHSAGVNSVSWCDSDDNLLLSAGTDPTLLLYDVRSPFEPLRRLEGHMKVNNWRAWKPIYKPAFFDRGRSVATPGPGSKKLTLYSVATGEMLSQGAIERDFNLVKCFSDEGKCRVFAAGKTVDELIPFWST